MIGSDSGLQEALEDINDLIQLDFETDQVSG